MTLAPTVNRSRRVAAASVMSALLLAPAATAQSPTPQAGATALGLSIQTPEGKQVLQGDRWSVTASASPYAPNTIIEVSFTSGATRIKRTMPLEVGAGGGMVRAAVPDRLRRATRIVVRAAIPAGQPLAPTAAPTAIVRQVPTTLRAGAKGLGVRVLQQMLAQNAYVVGRKGVYDARTQRAVLALRKVAGMAPTTAATPDVFQALRAGKGQFDVRFPSHGRHVEVDVDRRILVEIDGGRPRRIFHTSPGKSSTPTIRGSFRVYRKDPGTNAKGMYKSSYFIRGYAVHGFPSVPAARGASHGCLRVPMADAASIYAFMTIGMPVDTY